MSLKYTRFPIHCLDRFNAFQKSFTYTFEPLYNQENCILVLHVLFRSGNNFYVIYILKYNQVVIYSIFGKHTFTNACKNIARKHTNGAAEQKATIVHQQFIYTIEFVRPKKYFMSVSNLYVDRTTSSNTNITERLSFDPIECLLIN